MKAVDVPELRHLYNVVVFSSAGLRPDQHKLSLGDLDGDTYSVIWDYKIVKEFWGNQAPGMNQK
jgi:RNA-dependent RNA polymerase